MLAETFVAGGNVVLDAPDEFALIVERGGGGERACPERSGGKQCEERRPAVEGDEAEGAGANEERDEVAGVAFGGGDRGRHGDGEWDERGPEDQDGQAGRRRAPHEPSATERGEQEEPGGADGKGERAVGEVEFGSGVGVRVEAVGLVEPGKSGGEFDAGAEEIGVETVAEIGEVELFAVDVGEALGVVLDVEAQRAALDSAKFGVAEGVEAGDAGDGEGADGEVIYDFRFTIFVFRGEPGLEELRGGDAAEGGEGEETGGGAGVDGERAKGEGGEPPAARYLA